MSLNSMQLYYERMRSGRIAGRGVAGAAGLAIRDNAVRRGFAANHIPMDNMLNWKQRWLDICLEIYEKF